MTTGIADLCRTLALRQWVLKEEELAFIVNEHTGSSLRAERRWLEFKVDFDESPKGWLRILVEIVSLANTDGGLIVLGIGNNGDLAGVSDAIMDKLDPARIGDKLGKYVEGAPITVSSVKTELNGATIYGISVGRYEGMIVFSRDGNYNENGETKSVFRSGDIYVRKEGGKAKATGPDIESRISSIADSRVNQRIALIRSVLDMPAGTELFASPPNGNQFANNVRDGTVVRLIPVLQADVVPVDLPYSSLSSNVDSQVRHWKQSDNSFRLTKSTLAQWYERRHETSWAPEACELGFLSSLRSRGFPFWWASMMDDRHIAEVLDREAKTNAYPDREIIPYVIAVRMWDNRLTRLEDIGRSTQFPKVSKIIDRLMRMKKDELRFKGHWGGSKVDLDGTELTIGRFTRRSPAAEQIFARLVSMDAQGQLSASLRSFAKQLDIALYMPP